MKNRKNVFCSHVCSASFQAKNRWETGGLWAGRKAKPKPVRQKKCVECGRTKPITKFPKDARNRALSWYCLVCIPLRDERRRLAAIDNAARRRTKNPGIDIRLFSPKEWKALLARFRFSCAYCGLQKKLEQDHVVPLSRGGEHVKENIVPACRSCNVRKGNKLIVEWIAEAQLVQIMADVPVEK